MKRTRTEPEELLAAIADAIDDGFCPASILVPRFPKLSHRDLGCGGRAARRGFLLERRGPDEAMAVCRVLALTGLDESIPFVDS